MVFIGFVAAAALLIVVRLAQLMVFNRAPEGQPPVALPVVERGPILDRNGRILAISTRLDSVSAWVPSVTRPEETARLLAAALDLPAREIEEKLRGSRGFVYIERKISPTESQAVEALLAEGRLPGIELTPEYGRNYPEQTLASHVIGYVGVDNIGLEGVEYSFNEALSPAAVNLEQGQKELFGNQLFLTLDVNVQYVLEAAASEAMRSNRADAVYVLAMDAPSGELLGYCALPNFDPNEYNRYGGTALQNLPLVRAFEPGSVFKIFSIASFLELGGIDQASEFTCEGVYELPLAGGQSIQIRDLGSHGRVNAQRILMLSCNVGAARASETVDAESFYQMLLDFGFGRPTELPLPGESAGILAPPGEWSARSKPTIAFGQEISVSALQVLQGATVFANAGVLLKPLIVKRVVSPQGETVKEYGREPQREVLRPALARAVLGMMETATDDGGTARRGRVSGVRVSAKTGTAQVRDPVTGTYSKTHFVASYLGILPTDEPRLIIYVVIDHPRGAETYGSQVAAPVFQKVAEQLVDYFGLPRQGEEVIEHSGSVRIPLPGPLSVGVGSVMPDLSGVPKRRLLSLFKEGQLEIHMEGEGYVVAQDPPAGTTLSAGTTILLRLE